MAFSCRNNVNINLGGKYKLITSASMDDLTIVFGENEPYEVIIDGHILDCSYDSIFIVAAQRPRDSVPGIETMTQKKNEEAFEKSEFRQYWIVDKKKEAIFVENMAAHSNVYGPFKEEEYLKRREELGVTKTLKLKKLK